MPDSPNKLTRFWQELKRRKVVRVTIIYASTAFILLQLISILIEPLHLPGWVMTFFVVLLVVGFPIVVILAWIFDVTPQGIEVTSPVSQEVELPTIQRSRKKKIILDVIIGILLVIVVVLAWPKVFSTGNKDIHPDVEKSIAVLPFIDDSPEKGNAYIINGLMEEILNKLQKIKDLNVKSRTSGEAYRNRNKSIQEISKELDAKYILEGSGLKIGSKIKITIQLIEGETANHLWSNPYMEEVDENDLKGIFDIIEDVSFSVANELEAVITPEEEKNIKTNPTDNREAWDLYLMGKWFWNKWTASDIKKGMEYFNKAIELDSNFAMAYVGIAQAYNTLAFYDNTTPGDVFPVAKKLTAKALEIDSSIAEAHIASAYIKAYYDWDWAGSEESFKKAISINPENITAHHLYAYLLILLNRHDEAMAEIQKAISLDPFNLITNRTLGDFYYHMSEYDKAEKQLFKTLEMDSTFTYTHAYLGLVYLQKFLCEKASEELQSEIALNLGNQTIVSAWKAYAFGICGFKEEAASILNEFLNQYENKYIPPTAVAIVYLGLNEIDKSFEWLHKAFDEKDPWLTELKSRYFFTRLNHDPRYHDIVKKMGL